MNQKEALQRLLEEKIKRQQELKQLAKQLDQLDGDLTASRISRWFGSAFLLSIRIITALLAILFVVISIALIVSPELIIAQEPFIELARASVYRIMLTTLMLSIFLGITLFIISGLTAKMRKRNQQISVAQKQTQEIIEHHKSFIKDMEDEIETIRIIIRMN